MSDDPELQEMVRQLARERRRTWLILSILPGIPLFMAGFHLNSTVNGPKPLWPLILAPVALWCLWCADRILRTGSSRSGPGHFLLTLLIAALLTVLNTALFFGLIYAFCGAHPAF
jgi:hypothetical protein